MSLSVSNKTDRYWVHPALPTFRDHQMSACHFVSIFTSVVFPLPFGTMKPLQTKAAVELNFAYHRSGCLWPAKGSPNFCRPLVVDITLSCFTGRLKSSLVCVSPYLCPILTSLEGCSAFYQYLSFGSWFNCIPVMLLRDLRMDRSSSTLPAPLQDSTPLDLR